MEDRELEALLKDVETDRVVRTTSAKDGDKIGQAICAFANDLPATLRWVCCSSEPATTAVAPARQSPTNCSETWGRIAMTETFSRFHL